jgi:hypothetical protein
MPALACRMRDPVAWAQLRCNPRAGRQTSCFCQSRPLPAVHDVQRYSAIVALLRKELPTTKVLLLGVLPILTKEHPDHFLPDRIVVNWTWPSMYTEVCSPPPGGGSVSPITYWGV